MTLPSPSVGLALDAKYDCGFLNSSGSFVGLTLLRNKDGIPYYKETNDPGIATQLFTGQLGYANFKNQWEIQEGQDSFAGGLGQEYQDGTKVDGFFSARNVDARFKNMLIASPKQSFVTLPDVLTVTDGEMEDWADSTTLTNWTKTSAGSGTLTSYSLLKHGGSYSACLSSGGTNFGHWVKISQELGDWSTAWRGATVTIKYWIYRWDTNPYYGICNVIVTDGVYTTSQDAGGDSSGFTQQTIVHKISNTATKLELSFEAKGAQNSYVGLFLIDDVTFTVEYDDLKAICDFNDDVYFGIGKTLCKCANSGGAIKYVKNFDYDISSLEVFANNLYVAMDGENYWYMNTSQSFTQTNSVAKLFKTVGNTLKKTKVDDVKVYSSTNPSEEANWDSGTTIGSSDSAITDLEEIEGVPYIMKEDYPYYIEIDGEVYGLIPSLKSEKTTTSGQNSLAWQNKLYIPCGQQSLYEYDEGVVTDISPSKYIVSSEANANAYTGKVIALAADAQWLFAFVQNGSLVEVLAGQWKTASQWVWYPLVTLAEAEVDLEITCAYVSGVYKKRLWFGSEEGTLGYIPLTTKYGDILSDSDYNFETGGHLITPWLYRNLKGDKKVHYKITCKVKGGSENHQYWTAYYQKFEDTEWTEIGDFYDESSTLYLPDDATGNPPSSEMIRYKFICYTDNTTKTPVLLSYDVRGVWYPHHKHTYEIAVRVADNLILNNGQVDDSQSGSTLRSAIWAWINQTTPYPVAFYPLHYKTTSDVVYCKVLSNDEGSSFGYIVKNDITGSFEWVYELKLLVIPINGVE